ncbi:hypothetical protein CO174_02495 [Candidatus Uhrbacteria bacterium CG_4_9_14_3_um_filter_50_9]|uniref:Uncharacterized protein n=1 Tax=Candidatus Uhrbacteria bacterium CG_4_9_14_3_um_filter_50_9 TaxID=1975035 RepID=A0A2M7XCG0_9BACT|nr:MAG: hypothetical protein CO174_02495 [Candidatus Uhrbacteria bacterium CG_4_9_14_3_um_filter_50_9]
MTPQRTLVEALQEKQRLEAEAAKMWQETAERLADLIPSSLGAFAECVGWVRSSEMSQFRLVHFIDMVVQRHRRRYNPYLIAFRLRLDDEQVFESIEVARQAVEELAEAWKEHLLLEIVEQDSEKVAVLVYVVGLDYDAE